MSRCVPLRDSSVGPGVDGPRVRRDVAESCASSSPTISSGHMHPPSMPSTMPTVGAIDVDCSGVLKSVPASIPAPGADERPDDHEHGCRERVAPVHAEDDRADHHDEQRLHSAMSEVDGGLAEHDLARRDRRRDHAVVHAELAGADHRGAAGERVDEHEQHEHRRRAVAEPLGEESALRVDRARW